MVARRKSPQSSGKVYAHFAAITVVVAGLVALANLDSKAPAAAPSAIATQPPLEASLTVKEQTRQFDMAAGPVSTAADPTVTQSAVAVTPLASAPAAPARRNGPPPGDPALAIGVQHPSAPPITPTQPSAEQAAQLIAESRVRSGAANQGD